MSENTKELLKNLAYIGSVSLHLTNNKNASAQLRILDILAEAKVIELSILAEVLNMHPNQLTELLNKLEFQNEVHQVEDPTNKHTKLIFITDKGRKNATSRVKQHDISEDFFAGLSREEQLDMYDLLKKMIHGWKEEFVDDPETPQMTFASIDDVKRFNKAYFQNYSNEWEQLTEAWKEQARNIASRMR